MKHKMKVREYPNQIAVYNIGIKLIVPGYTEDGKYGYFICEQKKIKSRGTIKYCKISHFIPNVSESSFQDAINTLAEFLDE